MNKLMLSDEILMQVEKPARYIGNEINSVVKKPEYVSIRMAMCFPDVYEIGMSHLGIQILYDMFNRYEDVWCERVYSPWPDLHQIMKEKDIPLFGLESQEPVKNLDFLGITLQYEMCYTNILQILDLSKIPFYAKDRGENDPIVIGGGPCSYNPEPIADFFDFFYIGEGETRYREIFDIYKENRACGGSRLDFLKKICSLEGIYVPQFYETEYYADGTIKEIRTNIPEAPKHITKNIVTDFDSVTYPTKLVVPFIKCTQDRAVLEIQRGCIRGCRFCQAGQLYRPVREKNAETLKKYAVEMLQNTGYDEITLSSLSSSDYSELPELVDFLMEDCRKKKVNISLPSLRIDAFSLDVMSKVQDIKKISLTFAPEAGSQRLRNVINKGLSEEDILHGSKLAFEGGWTRVKLYFMLGLPTETAEDIQGIGDLANKIAACFFDTVPKEKRREQIQIVASTSFFVPKPFTPFQWAPMCTAQEFLDKAYETRKGIASQLNQKRIKYNWHEADLSVLEGVFARGDRKIAKVILKAYEKGCLFDSWSEYFRNDLWMEAFEECGVSIDFYTSRIRREDEIFPWDILDCGVSKEYLLREWKKAQEEAVTPNCRKECSGCGAAKYGCGVCREDRVKTGNEGEIQETEEKSVTEDSPAEEKQSERKTIKVRIKFSKHGIMRYIGHLDIMRYFQKVFRRAEIDIAYSGGFSPHQIMSFAAPLGVGLESEGEYLDAELYSLESTEGLIEIMNAQMSEGMKVLSAVVLPDKSENAMASVAAAGYYILFRDGFSPAGGWQREIDAFLEKEHIFVTKQTKKNTLEIDLKPSVYELKQSSYQGKECLYLLVNASSSGNIKPAMVMEALCNMSDLPYEQGNLFIVREDTYRNADKTGGIDLRPLDEIG